MALNLAVYCRRWPAARQGLVLIPAFFALVALPLWAQSIGPAPSSATPAVTAPAPPASQPNMHEMTAADVSAFIDGIVPAELAREDIAGAVVLVVKDGKVLFASGYGYSDAAKRTPVTPEGTLFRPGSISKLFTWTAVMQLVEAGKLDLDRDVNDYLDFKIPATYSKPITLRNILTHTAGFEETVKDMWVASPADFVPLGDYLRHHIPGRIFPPGVTPAYSNYACTLAGYIVQRVSGESYDNYIEHHIFAPLGMQHSTFRQPLPDSVKSMISNGYELGSGPAKEFELIQVGPAGSLSTTADDISHFMLAHLQDGKYEGAQILKPETAQMMHSRQFANDPRMNAMCLGFYEETRNGHRIIGHGGDTNYFHSDLHLMPDTGVGFFVSYNSMGKGEIRAREALWRQFLDRYFPYAPPAATAADPVKDMKMVSGSYIVSRRLDTSFLAVLIPLGQLKVTPGADKTIMTDMLKDLNGQPKQYREVGPLLFREVNGQDQLSFKRDDSGRIVMAIDFPFMVFQRAPWYRSSTLNMVVIAAALGVLLLTLVLWPIAYFTRRHYGQVLKLSPKLRKLRIWGRVVCAVDIVFVAGLVTFVLLGMKSISMFTAKNDIWLHLLQLLGWLGVLGTIVLLWNAVASWRSEERGAWSKLGDTLVLVAALGYSWFVLYWNLLHWVSNY